MHLKKKGEGKKPKWCLCKKDTINLAINICCRTKSTARTCLRWATLPALSNHHTETGATCNGLPGHAVLDPTGNSSLRETSTTSKHCWQHLPVLPRCPVCLGNQSKRHVDQAVSGGTARGCAAEQRGHAVPLAGAASSAGSPQKSLRPRLRVRPKVLAADLITVLAMHGCSVRNFWFSDQNFCRSVSSLVLIPFEPRCFKGCFKLQHFVLVTKIYAFLTACDRVCTSCGLDTNKQLHDLFWDDNLNLLAFKKSRVVSNSFLFYVTASSFGIQKP